MQETGIVKRQEHRILSNPHRVLGHFFYPGSEKRVKNIIDRVQSLSDDSVRKQLEMIISSFEHRHRDIKGIWMDHYKKIEYIAGPISDNNRKLLIGSYFSSEYTIEAAALFNPSMVPLPSQENLESGQQRYVLSLRATGEGHISSLEFASGIVQADGLVKQDAIVRFATNPKNVSMDGNNAKIEFDERTELSERVIFPITPDESNGIEDVRLVQFFDDNDESCYYGTYTAYDGHKIQSKMLKTHDFRSFQTICLQGKASQDKGMALFPSKINGKYAMISRQDGENMYIMFSDDLYTWDTIEYLHGPERTWEYVQLGNCGSPIETDKGWILITHSVGPMRQYTLGACLLDKDNPKKIIGTLAKPLMVPDESEREGYVPNVLYSCGSMKHNDVIVIPYAMSDFAYNFATVNIQELLNHMI